MTQKQPTNPLVYVGLTLAAAFAMYIAIDTFVLSTRKSSSPELDESIERLREAREKNK